MRSAKANSDKWHGKWHVQRSHLVHNHTIDHTELINHPRARTKRFKNEHKAKLKAYLYVGTPTRNTLHLIRNEYPDLLITSQDLYNLNKQFEREIVGNMTSAQYLENQLKAGNWFYDSKQDESGNLTYLVFAHPISIEYARKYNRVFLMDCTYKTNRFRMPLFHLIGLSPCNTTFSIAFCLMSEENEVSYTWVLQTIFGWIGPISSHNPTLCSDRELALVNAIDYLYPDWSHLLCIWHINQAVIKYCKKLFVRPDKKKAKRNRTEAERKQDEIEEADQQKAFKLFYSDWHYVVASPNKADYEQRWADFVC
jgi:hypothetical protein